MLEGGTGNWVLVEGDVAIACRRDIYKYLSITVTYRF